MALQFHIGDSYENGSLYVIDTVPITIATDAGTEDTDFPYTSIAYHPDLTVGDKTYKSHSFSLDGTKATEIFMGEDQTRVLHNFGGLWDFNAQLYDNDTFTIGEELVYDPTVGAATETLEEYQALFPDDWDDNWTTKYFIRNNVGNQNHVYGVPLNPPNLPGFNAKTAYTQGPNAFDKFIYTLRYDYTKNLLCWVSPDKKFGFSQFWTVDQEASTPDVVRTTSHQRFFGNAASYGGGGLYCDEKYLAQVRHRDDYGYQWVSFLGTPSEYTSGGYLIGSPAKPLNVPLPDDTIHSVACILEYELAGEKYYGFCVMSFGYDSERPEGERDFIYQTNVFGISENFFEEAEPEPTPEEGGDEEPGGNGRRPATINQGPSPDLMGLNFDLGLGRVNPATRGIKLTYMPLSTLNQYIDEYVESKTGELPSGSLADDLKLLVAPATEAIMQNCYDTILDVYKIPYTPSGMTSHTSFNIGGEVISISGASVFNGFAQKQTVELGIVSLPEIFGSYLDYAPNISAQIWLPFCGMYQIPINAFMGGQLRLQYIIDLLSGSCTAYLFGTDRFGHQTLIGSFGGDMKLPVPLGITAANTGIIGQALRSGMNTFANSPTKPFLTTRMAQENVGRGLEAYNFLQSNPDMPNAVGTGLQTGFGALAQIETGLKQTGKNIVGGIAKGAEFISQYREAMPELSGVIGQVGGVSGWCSWMQPYVRLTTPVRKNPEGYTYYLGKPANAKKTISSLGDGTFNRANAPRLNIPGALPQELDEIYNILTTGFYK